MRAGGDWLPVFWLLSGVLAVTKAMDLLRSRVRSKSRKRREVLEDASWTRHSYSEN